MSRKERARAAVTFIANVYEAGDGGFGSYRIPALLRLPDGTLLAFCEGREILSDHARNKIVLKTSVDDGLNWSEERVIAEAGDNALNNPLVVRETQTGDIVLMYQEYPYTSADAVANPGDWVSHPGQNFPANVHEGAVAEGYEGRICRTWVQRSGDGGRNWTARVDVTRQVKRPSGVTSYCGGPGIGIQLRHPRFRGRLVMPFTQGPWDNMKVYAVISDDGGHQWRYGEVAPSAPGEHANEVQMAELDDGRILLNARGYRGNSRRKLAWTDDGGETWSPLADAPDLPEPACQGSMVSLQSGRKFRGVLYCGPEDTAERRRGCLKLTVDGGSSWRRVATVYDGFFAYSSICELDEDSIGVLFERDDYAAVSFARVTID